MTLLIPTVGKTSVVLQIPLRSGGSLLACPCQKAGSQYRCTALATYLVTISMTLQPVKGKHTTLCMPLDASEQLSSSSAQVDSGTDRLGPSNHIQSSNMNRHLAQNLVTLCIVNIAQANYIDSCMTALIKR